MEIQKLNILQQVDKTKQVLCNRTTLIIISTIVLFTSYLTQFKMLGQGFKDVLSVSMGR